MALSKKNRKIVWDKSKGFCWYCGCDIPFESKWHADHFEPVYRVCNYVRDGKYKLKREFTGEMINADKDTIENQVPSCAKCNNFKMTFDVEFFRSELEAQIDRARKSSVNFRNCERFGLIEVKPAKVVFWFEKNIKSGVKND